jgi:serine/threonine-protein kinase RsbW
MGAGAVSGPHNSGDHVRLTIGSRLEQLAMVHALIEGLSRQYELDEETSNAILVAVIEAGTNAIQHGNAFDEAKLVTFEFTVHAEDIVVRVDDYGKGFDPAKVANPTDEAQLLNPHGRGLYLMRSLMDEVNFQTRPDAGTSVTLRKARPAA